MRSNGIAPRLPANPNDDTSQQRRPAGLDYVRLLRRARTNTEPALDERETLPTPLAPLALSAYTPRESDDPLPTRAAPADWFNTHSASSNFVQAVAHSETQSTALCSTIAIHVIDFCTTPAVLSRGNWMLRVTLDPRVLPDCILQLDLSFLRLALRFETRDVDSRTLVLRHVDTLEENLSVLLQRHAMMHDLEITVW